MTEFEAGAIRAARLLSNPGCYPTAALLALLPLAGAGLLAPGADVIVDAKSGISGAGKAPTDRTHFCENHGSVAAYGVFGHRHTPEMAQALGDRLVTFVPHLVPLDRGLMASIHTRLRPGTSTAQVAAAFEAAYAAAPFVRIIMTTARDQHVAHTNFCDIGWKVDESAGCSSSARSTTFVKGAAGQAIQNFNLMFGLDERAVCCEADAARSVAMLESDARWRRPADDARARVPLGGVHGGGREIDAALAAAGIPKRQVDGARSPTPPTLDLVVAVPAGTINTRFVAAINAAGGRAVGLTGADAGWRRCARRRPSRTSG